MASMRTFRWVAAIEATTFLALLVASVAKHSGHGATGVSVLGPIHGLFFLAYVFLVVVLRDGERWDPRTTAWILVGAVLPFGGYVVDAWLLRRRPVTS